MKVSFRIVASSILGFANSDHYIDSAPADFYEAAPYLWHRHYFYLGPKRRTAFYTDWGIGPSFVYKVTGHREEDDEIVPEEGSVNVYVRVAPGFIVSLYKNFRFFIGPYVNWNSFGLHAGLAF